MISVATGGARIGNVQDEFARTFDSVSLELSARDIENPLPYRDLWQWYGHWTGTESLKTYQSRRKYVATLFEPLVRSIHSKSTSGPSNLDDDKKPNGEIGSRMMAIKSSTVHAPHKPTLNPEQKERAIERIQTRVAHVEALDPSTLAIWSPRVDAIQASIDDALSRTFGQDTVEYKRYRRTVNWAAEIPSFGAETTLEQYRNDVTKGKEEVLVMLRQAIQSLQEELAEYDQSKPDLHLSDSLAKSVNIVIGHGGSSLWRELKDFIRDRLHLRVDEFNGVSTAGLTTVGRLTEMLDSAAFAFLVMTAEDQQPDGTLRARENVVHEIGLFQGRLGFKRAIVLLEEGCEEFSNIRGLGQIRFPKGNIAAKFEEIRIVLEREGLKPADMHGY